MSFYCYILKNDDNNTYNGFTVNLNRRIRQHNGIIKGGAKATKNKGPWSFYAIITGFETKNEALSCEWRIKHPTNTKFRPKKYCGINGRINSLNMVLNLDNWTSKSSGLSNNNNYKLYIDEKYINLIKKEEIKQNVEIYNIKEIFNLHANIPEQLESPANI
jgi:predicted GIY-YIG superfamily endonuclease